MPALEDLSPCDYAPGVHAFAIGWLGEGRIYTQGDVSREHFRQLAALLVNPWEPVATAGRHACPFVAAVASCPPMRSMAYLTQLRRWAYRCAREVVEALPCDRAVTTERDRVQRASRRVSSRTQPRGEALPMRRQARYKRHMDTPADFWAWFARTVLPVLARPEVPPAPLIDELDGRLSRLGCAWELGPAPEGRPGWAFAVSFGADLDRLPVAEAVVRCAPPMAGCAVLLGKPPKQWDGALSVRSGEEWVHLQTSTWTCHWFTVAGGVAIVVVPTDVQGLDDAEVLSVAEIALQATLGELTFAQVVRDVSVAPADELPPGRGVPQPDLPEHLHEWLAGHR